MKKDGTGMQDNGRVVSTDRRKEKRLTEEHELTISVLASGGRNLPKDKIIHTVCKDISPNGARIQSHSFLPVETPLTVKVALHNPPEFVTAFGKVKWIKSLFADEFYEIGLELIHAPS